MRVPNDLTSDAWVREQCGILEIKTGKNMAALAKIAGLSRTAFYDRLRNPADFRLRELRALQSIGKRYNVNFLVEEVEA